MTMPRTILPGLVAIAVLAMPALALAQESDGLALPWGAGATLKYDFGEDDHGADDRRDNLMFEGYLHQGIDVATVGPGVIEPFAELNFELSSERHEYWNNEVEPMLGIQWRSDGQLGEAGWSQIAVGIKGGPLINYRGRPGNDTSWGAMAYVTIMAGGKAGFWAGE